MAEARISREAVSLGTERAGSDTALGAGWVLRWDTASEPRPRVFRGRTGAGVAGLWRDGRGDFAVVDGYLLDTPRGATSDAARVAALNKAHGDAVADVLRGGHAAAIWDEARRRLVILRDALGLAPCFYARRGRVLLIATSIDALLARSEVERGVDRTVLAEYLQDDLGGQAPEETFHAGVRRLPPAHRLVADGDGRIEIARYWDPVPSGFAWADDAEAATFDPLLERAVRRCVAAGGDSLALSGGFDSVSVAVLAARSRGDAAPLHAVSLRFANTPCDESDTQSAVARTLGMPQHLTSLEDALGGEDVVTAALRLSAASPSPVLSPWQAAYTGLLRPASALGLSRLLMGTGGDDLLNVDPSYAADRLAARDWPALWRFCRACQRTSPWPAARVARGVLWHHALAPELARFGGRVIGRVSPPALDWVRARRRERALPAWAMPRDAELAMRLARRRARPSRPTDETAYVAVLRRVTQAPLVLIERDQSHAWARDLGFTFLFPYFDRDLVALSLRLRPEALLAGGRHKAPLRRLVATQLPDVRMPVRKVDFTPAVHAVLRPALARTWRRDGGPEMLAGQRLVDADRLNRFVDDYVEGRHARWLAAWVALSTEAWLRARADQTFTTGEEEAAA